MLQERPGKLCEKRVSHSRQISTAGRGRGTTYMSAKKFVNMANEMATRMALYNPFMQTGAFRLPFMLPILGPKMPFQAWRSVSSNFWC
jgi:hypothetical protein